MVLIYLLYLFIYSNMITDRLHQNKLVQVDQPVAVHVGLLKHSRQLRLSVFHV